MREQDNATFPVPTTSTESSPIVQEKTSQELSSYQPPTNHTLPQKLSSLQRLGIIFLGYLLGAGLLCTTTTSFLISVSPILIAISFLFAILVGFACIGDLALFGEQKRPHQWILSASFILALTILSIRLFMPTPSVESSTSSTFGWFGEVLVTAMNDMKGVIPSNFNYIFDIWKVLLALFALLIIMRLQSVKIRVCLLAILFAIPTLFLFANNYFWTIVLFLIGVTPIAIAFYLHYEPMKGVIEMRGVLQRIEPLFKDHPKLASDILRVAVRLHEGGPISQDSIAKITILPPAEVISKMVQMGIVIAYASKEKQTLTLDPEVKFFPPRKGLTPFLHKTLLIFIALGWALLPYDLIPDNIKIYGSLDDIIIAFLIF
ncbi:MAG: DUF1232 domain-containing protein, partial [bacterium]|nr:DUF1232 domain-containing protein [bacterium]